LQNIRLAVSGVFVGTVAAFSACYWLQSKLTSFAAPTVMPFGLVAFGVIALTQLASFFPARRAAWLNLRLLTSG
jgi:ABC-type lipoprotein release transport system permease subunit